MAFSGVFCRSGNVFDADSCEKRFMQKMRLVAYLIKSYLCIGKETIVECYFLYLCVNFLKWLD